MMEVGSTHITPAAGNVFADLGFDPSEAEALKRESQQIIARKLAIKATDAVVDRPSRTGRRVNLSVG